MSNFPLLKTGAVLQYPASRVIEHSTSVLVFLDGSEQRFREYPTPIRRWIIRLELLDESEMAAIEDFLVNRQGCLGSFAFMDPRDGIIYPDCSLQDDENSLEFRDLPSGCTTLVVRENRN